MLADSTRATRRPAVRTKRRGSVAVVLLDNPPLHLITIDLLHDLRAAVHGVAADSSVRALVLGATEGRAFSAGSDMREFAGLGADAAEHKILFEDHKILFEDLVLREVAHLLVPTVAAVDGPALGGGLELALACDLRIARAGVQLGLTESRIGGLAGTGSQRLTKLIGPSRAKQLLFTGTPIDAELALDWGLVNEVVPDGTFDHALALAGLIASRGPLSNRLAKELVDRAVDVPLDAGLVAASVAQQRIFDGSALAQGVNAFFAKREAVFR